MSDHAPDATDRAIINALQGGFPVTDRPFAEVASWLNTDEADVIARISAMLDAGMLSRFGPMYNMDRLGGAITLAAMSVPADRFDAVSEQVNAHREVAHNYERDHELNMWFVAAAETRSGIDALIERIEAETGLPVFQFPKEREYFIGLRLQA